MSLLGSPLQDFSDRVEITRVDNGFVVSYQEAVTVDDAAAPSPVAALIADLPDHMKPLVAGLTSLMPKQGPAWRTLIFPNIEAVIEWLRKREG